MSSLPKPPKRVAIIGLYHESNTFIPSLTQIESFQRSVLLRSEEIRQKYGNAHHEISGFFQTLEEAGIEAVPILFAHAMPWGKVSDKALQRLWGWIEEGIDNAGALDGILAAPHGAGVGEVHSDLDGWWLGKLREKVGAKTPIIATMDPHVNLSPAMVQACDGMVAYRENPHLDQRQRGIEAAKIMVRTVRGEIAPVAAAVFPPIAINIERQLTSVEPMLSVQRELDFTRALPGILSASVTLGFPYADVPEMGSAFIVVADGNPELARREAERLGNWLREHRERFRGEMISPEEALARVADSPRPVGLLDMGDNVGGGGPGDSTVLAGLALREQRWRTLFYLPDVESVEAATAAGIGGKIRLKLGGKLPMTPAGPLDVEASVISFHDGHFSEKEARHGGKTGGSMGPCAVVQVGDQLTALLMTLREGGSYSIQPLLSCGLNPADYDIIIIKGVHAPVAAYTSVCPTLIRVNTPGVTCADLQTLNFCHRRVPLFPFEEV